MLKLALALAAFWLIGFAVLYVAMARGPASFSALMARLPMWVLGLYPAQTMLTWATGGALQRGDPAPDFDLPRANGAGSVKLSSLRGRPVVLIFGSHT